jgi:hypothetical protein
MLAAKILVKASIAELEKIALSAGYNSKKIKDTLKKPR